MSRFSGEPPIHPTGESDAPPIEVYADEVYDDGFDAQYDLATDVLDAATSPSQRAFSVPHPIEVLRTVLASKDGHTPDDVAELVAQLEASSPPALEAARGDYEETYKGVFEMLRSECFNRIGGKFYFESLPLAVLYNGAVQAELDAIVAITKKATPLQDPYATWRALLEEIQRGKAKRTALHFVQGIEQRETVEKLVEDYSAIAPPTTQAAKTRPKASRTARAVIAEDRASKAGAPKIRISSGLPSLDIAYTGVGDPRGFIGLGEGAVIAAATGSGKSSFSYTTTAAMTQDLINYGINDGLVLFFHTEEESIDKLEAMEISEGQKFHHLADNLLIDACGTDRQRVVETVYDCVIDADKKARATNRPITDFLPYVIIIDYVQSLSAEGESEVVATMNTAELILRGFQAWNPKEMAKFGGVDFRAYAGMSWPAGQEHHRVATISYAQLVKQNDGAMFYRPGHRDSILSDFTLEDEREPAGWYDAQNNPWCWEVREGDARILRQNAIRGSGIILQNATTIVFLHRSRPRNNPAVEVAGKKTLQDTRARLILDKTRTGSTMPYVPLDFNINASGKRARFYDTVAETALAQGRFEVASMYSSQGDPMLPIREARRPLAGYRY